MPMCFHIATMLVSTSVSSNGFLLHKAHQGHRRLGNLAWVAVPVPVLFPILLSLFRKLDIWCLLLWELTLLSWTSGSQSGAGSRLWRQTLIDIAVHNAGGRWRSQDKSQRNLHCGWLKYTNWYLLWDWGKGLQTLLITCHDSCRAKGVKDTPELAS